MLDPKTRQLAWLLLASPKLRPRKQTNKMAISERERVGWCIRVSGSFYCSHQAAQATSNYHHSLSKYRPWLTFRPHQPKAGICWALS